MARFKEICQDCYLSKGFTVLIKQGDDSVWHCDRCGANYEKDTEGVLQKKL